MNSANAVSDLRLLPTRMLKGDSRLASSLLKIYVSLFQPTTVCFKEFYHRWNSLKQLLRVGTRIRIPHFKTLSTLLPQEPGSLGASRAARLPGTGSMEGRA